MMKKLFDFNQNSSIPKYRQLINSIIRSIDSEVLNKGDKVPSINQICTEFNLSRDTVMVAFNELKAKGILMSQPGKGYYIASTNIKQEEKIFVVFDELNSFKEDLYNSFLVSLESRASVDIFFHHFNYRVFKNLILESIGNYTSYVIMPATFDNTSHLVNKLPKDKVYILDRLKADLADYPVVYQDFENDLYNALNDGLDLIKKYRKLVLVNPGGKEPMEREKGFLRFCDENDFHSGIVKNLQDTLIERSTLYIVISDRDLVQLVKSAQAGNLVPGKNIGIISLNDTMLKEVVLGGITTISTDFKAMGARLAQMILSKEKIQVRNPASFIVRSSV
ncbi:MAG: GntR family transcriptional regulator [Prolixibacteraceae bacterium]|nr:GntR family transcriptional regulator [Prolixibacteraceae bacterium]